MNQEEIVFSELDEVKTDSSFIQTLARYYSDFLATDFKKERLPKRRFQTRDSKGRRAGIALEKFPSFLPLINKIFSGKFLGFSEFIFFAILSNSKLWISLSLKDLSLLIASLAAAQSVMTIGNKETINKVKILKSLKNMLK